MSQLDVLPTVAKHLGYEIEGGAYKGKEKYIYHLDDELEEVFDLSEDPTKSQNLTVERTPEELKERRSELLQWRTRVNSPYAAQASA